MNGISEIAWPEWTECPRREGLDPLGMQNTSIALYQELLPGIGNATLRMRYYGLYAWLSWMYACRIGHTDPKSWQRLIRRAEALYALIAQRRGGETGVAGVRWAEKKLEEEMPGGLFDNMLGDPSDVMSFEEDAEPGSPDAYLKQSWGAYGAAYGSQLFNVGVLASAEGHEIATPSSGIGINLAKTFDEGLGGLSGEFFEAVERGSVSARELDAFALIAPSEIPEDSVERQLYQDILFGEAGLDRREDRNRRDTLLLILELAGQLGRAPGVPEVRWALYAGCAPDGTPIVFSDNLRAQEKRWRLYHTNDLGHVCLETLLKFTLDILERHPAGLPLADLIGETVNGILSAADSAPGTWQDFLDGTDIAQNASLETDAGSEISLVRTALRAARGDAFCEPESAWTALRLLAVLHKKAQRSFGKLEKEFAAFDRTASRSSLTELRFLEDRLSLPFQETLGKLIEERVVQRHLQVALRKFCAQGAYTYLLEVDDGKIRLRGKDGPVFTNPRLASALAFLKDIHLLEAGGLTELGRKKLAGSHETS